MRVLPAFPPARCASVHSAARSLGIPEQPERCSSPLPVPSSGKMGGSRSGVPSARCTNPPAFLGTGRPWRTGGQPFPCPVSPVVIPRSASRWWPGTALGGPGPAGPPGLPPGPPAVRQPAGRALLAQGSCSAAAAGSAPQHRVPARRRPRALPAAAGTDPPKPLARSSAGAGPVPVEAAPCAARAVTPRSRSAAARSGAARLRPAPRRGWSGGSRAGSGSGVCGYGTAPPSGCCCSPHSRCPARGHAAATRPVRLGQGLPAQPGVAAGGPAALAGAWRWLDAPECLRTRTEWEHLAAVRWDALLPDVERNRRDPTTSCCVLHPEVTGRAQGEGQQLPWRGDRDDMGRLGKGKAERRGRKEFHWEDIQDLYGILGMEGVALGSAQGWAQFSTMVVWVCFGGFFVEKQHQRPQQYQGSAGECLRPGTDLTASDGFVIFRAALRRESNFPVGDQGPPSCPSCHAKQNSSPPRYQGHSTHGHNGPPMKNQLPPLLIN